MFKYSWKGDRESSFEALTRETELYPGAFFQKKRCIPVLLDREVKLKLPQPGECSNYSTV